MIYRISPFQNETILDILTTIYQVDGIHHDSERFIPLFTDLQNEESDLTFEMNREESILLAEGLESSLDHMESPYLEEAELIAQMLRRIAGEPDEGGFIIHDLTA